MKNLRKIVAILAAVLMFCSLIPMSVFAAPGDVVLDVNFNDGTNGGFERSVNENGYIVFDATTADWQNTHQYISGIKANTHYVVTFKAKANKEATLTFKINNDWAGDVVSEVVDVTTEWQDYELNINSGDLNAAIVMFSSGYEAPYAPIYCIDDVKIVEAVDPELIGKVINGDFEDGTINPWKVHQQVTVEAEAAYEGNYGAHLKDNGTWGGIMDQILNVEAGKSYELSFWIKVNKFGLNLQIKDGDANGPSLASGTWYDYNSHSNWTKKTYVVTPTTNGIFLNFCGGGNGTPDPAKETDTYVDSLTIRELKDPSFDGYITNGDFETGDTQSWESVWGSAQLAIVEGRNGGSAMKIDAGMYQVTRQKVNVKPNTDYVVQVYAKNATTMALLPKSYPADANIPGAQITLNGGDEWTQNSMVFNSGDNNQVYICVMGNVAGSSVIVDDFFMFEKVAESNDGYIVNGTFETGALTPWNNLWGSCPKAEIVRGGMDSNFALDIVSGQWKHVRQTNIAVEANTDYKITAYAKNAKNMSLLVKDGGDSVDLVNAGVSAGDEWTEFTAEFNTGDYTTIIFSLMGSAEEAYGTFDNIVMEKIEPACEHEYFSPCDQHCMICGELTNPEASHNIVHVEAVAPTCTTMGNLEFWYCDVCGAAWLDEAGTLNTNMMAVKLPAAHSYDYACSTICNVCWEETNPEASHNLTYHAAKDAIDCANPGNIEYYSCEYCGEAFDAFGNGINSWFITITVDCVRPEGVADCAIVTCETCGNEIYGYGEHDVLTCKGGLCSKCDTEVEGYGCANYDTPNCEDGVCYYCGDFVAGFGHENGAWYPCVDGECAYGCGLTYPATEAHIDEDADDYCDLCWTHLAHIDEDADGWCDICWSEMPQEPVVEIVYGDADGDGEVTNLDSVLLDQYLAGWDVTLNEVAADADGDGEVTNLDSVLLDQYLAGWDVNLGPAPLFNDGVLGGW